MRILLVLLIVFAGCGSSPSSSPADASTLLIARSTQTVAYEGQPRFVTSLESDGQADFSSASVEVEPGGALTLVSSACSVERCGVILAIADTVANRGQSVPAPIDGVNHYVYVDTAAGRFRGLISVRPLDAIELSSGMSAVSGLYLASSLQVGSGAVFQSEAPGLSWIVFGDATLEGAIQVEPDTTAFVGVLGEVHGAGMLQLGREGDAGLADGGSDGPVVARLSAVLGGGNLSSSDESGAAVFDVENGNGVWIDVAALSLVTSDDSASIAGSGPAGVSLTVTNVATGDEFDGDVDDSGRFSITVELAQGQNSFRCESDVTGMNTRSFVGTSVEFETVDHESTAKGALVDIVRL